MGWQRKSKTLNKKGIKEKKGTVTLQIKGTAPKSTPHKMRGVGGEKRKSRSRQKIRGRKRKSMNGGKKTNSVEGGKKMEMQFYSKKKNGFFFLGRESWSRAFRGKIVKGSEPKPT